MARIEEVDLRVPLSESLGGVQTDVAADAPARGLAVAGSAIEQLAQRSGAAFEQVGRNFVQRQNEREYTQALTNYWDFETNLLNGDGGFLRRPAESIEGSTEEAVRKLNEYVAETAKNTQNPIVRDEFIRATQKEIARTKIVLARNEGDKLEGLRVSSARAALSARMQKVTTLEPDRFLPHVNDEGSFYADPELILEVESQIQMINKDWSDAEVHEAAKQAIATEAAQAVYYQLDQGPGHAKLAKDIADAYGPYWEATTRAGVERRIKTEVESDMMDPAVTGAVASLSNAGKPLTKLNLSREAMEQYRKQYRDVYGEDPSDDALQEVKRRSIAEVSLIEDHQKEVHSERRGGELTKLIQLTQSDPRQAEFYARKLLESARGEDDLSFAESVSKILTNVRESRGASVHPKQTTMAGFAAINGEVDLANAPKDQLLSYAAEMSQTDYNNHIGPILGFKGKIPSAKEMGDALDRARFLVKGKTPYRKNGTNIDGAYVELFNSLQSLAEQHFEQNGRVASAEELAEYAQIVHFSLDDKKWDDGSFTGQIGEMLADPDAVELSTKDPRDLSLLTLLTESANSDQTLAAATRAALGADITPEALAKNPRVMVELLRLSLTLNPTVFTSDTGATVQFRSNLSEALGEGN